MQGLLVRNLVCFRARIKTNKHVKTSFKETEFFVTIFATDMNVNNTDNLSPSNTVIISRKLWIITLLVILVTQLIFYIDIYNFIQELVHTDRQLAQQKDYVFFLN